MDIVMPTFIKYGVMCSYDETATDEYVVIPDGVEIIGSNCFASASEIKEIVMPDSVTKICPGAFYGCTSLEKIKLSKNIKKIGESAFFYCQSLDSIEIPEQVVEIAGNTFSGCEKLRKIFIPKNVSKIGYQAFQFCHSIEEIEVDKENQFFCTYNGILYDKEKKIIIRNFNKDFTNYKIPESVVNIGSLAFESSNGIENVILPKTIKKTNFGIFEKCTNLETISTFDFKENISEEDLKNSLIIPDGVKEIGDLAFSSCTGIKKVFLQEGFNAELNCTFFCCENLKNVTLPTSLKNVDKEIFYNSGYVLENTSPYEIKDNTFVMYNGEIKGKKNDCLDEATGTFYIPKGITRIAIGAFKDKKNIKKIVMPDSITEIGESAFDGCENLSEIKLSENLCKIGQSAFSNCTSLKEIFIPKSVTDICKYAFCKCNSFKCVYILENVNNIEENAFFLCSNLKQIIVDTNNKKYSSAFGALFDKEKKTILEAPCILQDDFEIPESVNTIGNNCFTGCINLESVTIPNSITQFNNCVFTGCTDIENVSVVEDLAENQEKSKYKKLVIPNTVTKIGHYAFSYSRSIKNVYLQEGLKKLGPLTFFGCEKIESIDYPKSLNIKDPLF